MALTRLYPVPSLKCPYCGADPTFFVVVKMPFATKTYDYVYLAHYSKEQKKAHKWYLGPVDEETRDILKQLNIYGAPIIVDLQNPSQILSLLPDLKIDPDQIAKVEIRIYRRWV